MTEEADTGAEETTTDGPTPEERAARAERELAIVRAGIDTSGGMGAFFASHYEGEATEEAVRAAALEAGVLSEETNEAPDPVIGEDESESTERRRAASTGAAGPEPDEHPTVLAERAFEAARREGSREDAIAAAVRTKASALANGDRRATVTVPRRS